MDYLNEDKSYQVGCILWRQCRHLNLKFTIAASEQNKNVIFCVEIGVTVKSVVSDKITCICQEVKYLHNREALQW